MLENRRIAELVLDVARTQALDEAMERVTAEEMVDSYGDLALRLLVVLKPDGLDTILESGKVLDFAVGVHDGLQAAGEDRFPFIDYATEQDLRDAEQGILEGDG